jgi:hypothetical protein
MPAWRLDEQNCQVEHFDVGASDGEIAGFVAHVVLCLAEQPRTLNVNSRMLATVQQQIRDQRGSGDIINKPHPVLGYHINIACNGISHGYINRNIIDQPEILHIIPCYETKTPHIVVINIGQYMFGKFFIIACKSFKKITGGGLNMFNAGCFFQQLVKKTYNAACYKERTEIPDQDQEADNKYKPDPVISYVHNTLCIGVGKYRNPAVNG